MSDTIKIIEEARRNVDVKHAIAETGRRLYNSAGKDSLKDSIRKEGIFMLTEGLLADNPPRPNRGIILGKERS